MPRLARAYYARESRPASDSEQLPFSFNSLNKTYAFPLETELISEQYQVDETHLRSRSSVHTCRWSLAPRA